MIQKFTKKAVTIEAVQYLGNMEEVLKLGDWVVKEADKYTTYNSSDFNNTFQKTNG